jgi:3-(3-hydroxy-phenyl)propionate hydroxylase
VIGADGAGSSVRRSLDIGFEGTSYEDRFLVLSIDFPLEDVIPGIAWVNYVSDPDEWLVLLKTPHIWRVLFPVAPSEVATAGTTPEMRRRLGRVAPEAADAPITDSAVYTVHQRVATTFLKERVLLAGDAAHVNSPIGGMGMNSGIADAFSAASAVAGAIELGGMEGLDDFAETRRSFAREYVQVATRRNTENLGLKDPATMKRRYDELRAIASDPERSLAYLAASCLISDRVPAQAETR